MGNWRKGNEVCRDWEKTLRDWEKTPRKVKRFSGMRKRPFQEQEEALGDWEKTRELGKNPVEKEENWEKTL